MGDILAELVSIATKHDRLSITSTLAVIAVLYKHRKVLLKIMHRERVQMTQLDRTERKVDAIMSALGVEGWDAHSENTSILPRNTSLKKRNFLLFLAGLYRARTTTECTSQTGRSDHSKTREGNIPMKKKLLSRKFILALATGILVILNDGLDLGLKTDTIMYVVGIVATWIIGESAVDVGRKTPEVKNEEFTTSTENFE